MAIFSTKFSAVKRSQGKNAVGSAAYISRNKLTYTGTDTLTGDHVEQAFDYTPDNAGLIHSEILAPAGAPHWVYDREQLWNKCEEVEKRKDAQTALKYMFALPKELTMEQNIELAQEFAKEYLVSQGMVVDMALHFDKENNPHVHYQMTTRKLEGEEFAARKTRDWSKSPFVKHLNKGVADTINKHLELYGHLDRVSHLSFKDRGIDLKPGIHEGPGRYIRNSELARKNKEILLENSKRIAENPELVLDKLSINKPVFTKEDIAKALDKVITDNLLELKTTGKDNNIEELNHLLQQEFLSAYATVMASEQLTLVVEEDIRGRTLYALTKRLELEERYEQVVHELHEIDSHKLEYKEGNNDKEGTSYTLSKEQKRAVKEILEGTNISVLEGIPGAGKTTVMKEIVAYYQAAGKRVIGAAPSSVAALNLASVTGIEAKNLAQWRKIWQEAAGQKFELNLRADYYKEEQYQHGQSSLTANDIIIVDEAGMVELSNMDYMLQEVRVAGAKVILVGDNNQLSAIGMGGALKKASGIVGSSRLVEVRRQKNSEHARASQLLGDYKIADALDILHNEKCFNICSSEKSARNTLVKDYVSSYLTKASALERDDIVSSDDRSLVIAAYTNKTVDLLNKQVRSALKDSGIIKGIGYNVNLGHKSLDLCIGEQVVFKQNNSRLNILNGEVGTVLSINNDNRLTPIIKARITKGDGSSHIVSIDVVKDKYHYIDYGYALNAHKLQGITVDETYLIYEKEMGYEAFNVLATRHRERLSIYAAENTLKEHITAKLGFGKETGKHVRNIEESGDRPLWLTGLGIGISRRSNLNFARDYISGETKDKLLSTNDQVIKDYIDARTQTLSYIREINSWTSRQSSVNGSKRPPLWEHELWEKYTEVKAARNNAASAIVNNYPDFAARISQLDLNFTTIKEHAGDKSLKYNIKYTDELNTVTANDHYVKLIKDLKALECKLDLGEKFKGAEAQSLVKTFKSNHYELQSSIAELKATIAVYDRQIVQTQERKYELEDHVLNSQTYRNELFPNYLRTIYKADPSEIIANWNSLKNKAGLEAALSQIKAKPETLNPKLFGVGSLKGTGLGTILGSVASVSEDYKFERYGRIPDILRHQICKIVERRLASSLIEDLSFLNHANVFNS